MDELINGDIDVFESQAWQTTGTRFFSDGNRESPTPGVQPLRTAVDDVDGPGIKEIVRAA